MVDDSSFSRRVLKLLLERQGSFRVVGEAVDGEEGLALARELRPDVITLDMDMPRLNGLETLARLRQENDIPVVIVTALPPDHEHVKTLYVYAGVETVMKTYSSSSMDLSVFGNELISRIQKVVRSRRQPT